MFLSNILTPSEYETFTGQFQNELEEVETLKRALKLSDEADREENFVKYRDSLLAALKSAIALTYRTI